MYFLSIEGITQKLLFHSLSTQEKIIYIWKKLMNLKEHNDA